MKKTVLFVALVVIVAVAFAACGTANTVSGLWYDKAGMAGTMEFKSGGVVTMTMMGVNIDGTYTFDAAKSEGSIKVSVAGQEGTTAFKLANGELTLDNGAATYTRNKVEQQDLGDVLNNLGNAAGN